MNKDGQRKKQLQRIWSILQESDSDVALSDPQSIEERDNASERSMTSDIEQDISDNEENMPLSDVRLRLETSHSSPLQGCAASSQPEKFSIREVKFSQDGTVWGKIPFRTSVRTRAANIIRRSLGVVPEASFAKSEIECWSLFFYQ